MVFKCVEGRIRLLKLLLGDTSCSWIWVCMLGSMQRRTDKFVRLSAEESCSIYKSYEGFWMGNLGSA